jgi:hypothetical protein
LAHSTALLASRESPEYLATPDLLGLKTVGEIKTTVHDWQTVQDVPARYLDQMQWQMFVTGSARCFLVFEPHENFVPIYMEPKHFIIPADQERQETLEALAEEFLQSDDEPDEEAAELEALLDAYLDEKELEDAQHARTDAAKSALEDRIAGQPTKHVGSRAFLTRSEDTTRRQFSATKLKADHPELWDAYAEPIPVKGRLTITVRSDHND